MKTIAIFLIRLVSQFFRVLGGRACRFHPSCSAYAIEAFSSMRPYQALLKAASRVCRCHPFSHGGYDPLWKKELS